MPEEVQILDARGNPIQSRANLRNPVEAWLYDALVGTKSTAGERVSPDTAITVMAFFACVRNISEDIAKLPKWVMQHADRKDTRLPEHPVSRLMLRPSSFMNRHVFWMTYLSHALTREAAHAYIVRDGSGNPVELILLDPDQCRVRAASDTGEPLVVAYGRVLFPYEVISLYGLSDMGIRGFPATEIAKQVIGAAIAMQKMRGSFFGNGMMPSGILTHPASLNDEAKERLRREFMKNYSGSEAAFNLMLLDAGFKFEQMSFDPEKAEFPALTAIGIEDICRLFRMPPHKIQHLKDAHYSNVEELNLDYKGDTLDPWAHRLRCEIEFKLLRKRELDAGLFLDINLKALERGNLAARKDFYNFMYYAGAYNANRILELEHENPVPDGERYFNQRNLVPADRMDDLIDKETKPATEPGAAGPAAPPPQPSPADAFRQMLEAKIADLLREEIRNIDKAKEKKRDWVEFYDKREKTIAAHMGPYFVPVLQWFGSPISPSGAAEAFARDLCAESMECLEQNDLDAWRAGRRAAEAAQKVMEILCDVKDAV